MFHDEEPALLIQECIENFKIAPDKLCINRTRDALKHLSHTRDHLLSTHQNALSQLNRNLSTLQSQHSLATQSHNSSFQASEMHRLETTKFRVAKEAQDAEIEVEKLGTQIRNGQRSIEEMESFGDEGGQQGREARDDEAVLKLKVYRMLGIDVEKDEETGVYNKATVRSRERGDVRVVNVDPKFSRFFYANYFWGAL